MSIKYGFKTDAALNDSSKIFTVPNGEVWVVTHVNAQLTATATVGNRRLRVIARDAADTIVVQAEAGATFAATETQNADFFPGAPDNSTEINDTLKVAMPILILLPGWDLVVEDGTAVDAAADDMTVSFIYSIRVP